MEQRIMNQLLGDRGRRVIGLSPSRGDGEIVLIACKRGTGIALPSDFRKRQPASRHSWEKIVG